VSDDLIREFYQRWHVVAEIEAEEQKEASISLRWQQTNAILRLALGLGLPLNRSTQDEAVVRCRWAKLKGSQV